MGQAPPIATRRKGIFDQLNTRHPGESRDPVTFAQRTEVQSHWVPDIASRFRNDEQKPEPDQHGSTQSGVTGT
jgi:hypothetical protein